MASTDDEIPDLLHDRVLTFLNAEFSDGDCSARHVREVYEKLLSTKREWESKLSVASTDSPHKVGKLLALAERSLKRSDLLLGQKESLTEEVCNKVDAAQTLASLIREDVSSVLHAEKYFSYLQWVEHIDAVSGKIQAHVEMGNLHGAVTHFKVLSEWMKTIHSSECSKLLHFLQSTTIFWYSILADGIGKEFEEILSAIKWPFVSAVIQIEAGGQHMPSLSPEQRTRFDTVFSLLLHLRPLKPGPESEKLLPLQLLEKPLRKRFIYHFCGNKKTNCSHKPEWYYTQILTWIRGNRHFLHRVVQPLLDKAGFLHVNVEVEFAKGLVEMAVQKLSTDIADILYDDETFSHVINETLLFEKDLRSLGLTLNQPNCLQVLCRDDCFAKWLAMEKKYATSNVDAAFASPSAWQLQYRDNGEWDQLHIPTCAETFLTMILAITERYKMLPAPRCRLRFLRLQMEILDDFRVRLFQLSKQEAKDPLSGSSHFCSILNAINYVILVLKEWSDLPFFLRLQFYTLELKRLQGQESCVDSEMCTESESLNSSCINDAEVHSIRTKAEEQEREMVKLLKEEVDDECLTQLEGTAFDEIVALLEHMKEDMLRSLQACVCEDVIAKSRAYKKEKWFSFPSPGEFVKPSVTPSACSMLMALKSSLHFLKESLASPLFNKLWQNIAFKLDTFIYEEVILSNRFNEGGAKQMQFDATRNFFPIFSAYTQQPHNFFKMVKESCILLTLNKGSAMLLLEVLQQAQISAKDLEAYRSIQKQDPVDVLEELGIYKLPPLEAMRVLKLRTDVRSS